MLNKKPRILHISCHGIRNCVNNIGLNFEEMKQEGHFLLFETPLGEGNLVSSKKLNDLLDKTTGDLDVVFVAACDSEFVGKIFLRCGAKHVICVKKERFVLDEAAIAFTEIFYSQIIQKGLSICEAFAHAKAVVEFKFEVKEADLFIKFTEEQLVEFESMGAVRAKPHACYTHPKEKAGSYECISNHIQFK